MRTPPPDLSDDVVAAVVGAHWFISSTLIDYAAVGFGSHHWLITGPSGRWFVTADAVADCPAPMAELAAALATAHALRHRCGLDFVVAPHLNADRALLSVSGRYAIAVYPYLERSTDAAADPGQLLSMIAAVHAATSQVAGLVMVDDLTLPHRAALEAVLGGTGPDPSCGPFAAEFATLVRAHRRQLRAALDRYDLVAAAVGADRSGWVVTHGEAKPNNTMVTAAGPVLVDWDTVRLAPPARDVWLTGSVDAYSAATGRDVSADHVDFYARRWDLKDLCGSAGWFTVPHQRTADTELAWHGSIEICRRLGQDRA